MKKRFVEFLKENEAYDSFVQALQNSRAFAGAMSFDRYMLSVRHSPKNYVGRAFFWEATPEGASYWEAIEAEWLELLKTTITE